MTTDAQAPIEAPKKQSKARLVLLIATIGIAGGLGYNWWHGQHYVSTDNAQIEGRIVPIAARVAGYVTEVQAEDNQTAKQSELLVKIDDRDYKAKLLQADAELAVALSNAGKQGNDVGQAVAQISWAQANASAASANIKQSEANLQKARNDYERTRSLAAQAMASQQQLDAAETAVRTAEAQLKTARDSASAAGEQVTVYSAALRTAKSKVDAARAVRDLAAIQLADTELKAPTTGMVSKKNVEVGQLVQPGQTLMSLVTNDDIWVVANVKETDVGKVQPGAKAEIEVDAYPGMKFEGKVESISAATGAKFTLLPPDNATGNFTKVVQRIPVKIRLAQTADQKHPLRPGMSVNATIEART
ncbi:membrane fusion protein (multidrug efflux system) [Chitinivorax tropicus]|uniref:Membrane fusion protein (Multidrug efflux system) n=1 Tax=Chitinivorax tropicus TaxID=714531 RepID=A0A840MGH6_9PROT|nr:HlyD family secretion protein [Chitinivorax tropicus]MBB5017748.1 membrane fusion protein (multidrug efflux system) [Chitinivorax tropicus]